ncbi:MAG: flagellar basal body P-ring formation chaperone FlgA [Pseudomonadota bacterium]
MAKMTQTTLLAATVGLLLVSFSHAAGSATLKPEISVYGDVVYAKDLFDDAGDLADEPLFLAPDLGKSGTISATRVAKEAHAVGLFDIDLNANNHVTVHRPSRIISREVLTDALKDRLSDAMSAEIDFEVTTSTLPEEIHTDPRSSEAFSIGETTFMADDRRFHATVDVNTHTGLKKLPVQGVITEMVTVATLTRDVQRDDILGPGDITQARIAKSRSNAKALQSIDGIIGKAVTRRLSENSVLRENHIAPPLLVRSNERVTITYAVPGLILTAQGRALDNGPEGGTISVMNLQSKRIVRAVVSARGEVLVEARTPLKTSSLAAN